VFSPLLSFFWERDGGGREKRERKEVKERGGGDVGVSLCYTFLSGGREKESKRKRGGRREGGLVKGKERKKKEGIVRPPDCVSNSIFLFKGEQEKEKRKKKRRDCSLQYLDGLITYFTRFEEKRCESEREKGGEKKEKKKGRERIAGRNCTAQLPIYIKRTGRKREKKKKGRKEKGKREGGRRYSQHPSGTFALISHKGKRDSEEGKKEKGRGKEGKQADGHAIHCAVSRAKFLFTKREKRGGEKKKGGRLLP